MVSNTEPEIMVEAVTTPVSSGRITSTKAVEATELMRVAVAGAALMTNKVVVKTG